MKRKKQLYKAWLTKKGRRVGDSVVVTDLGTANSMQTSAKNYGYVITIKKRKGVNRWTMTLKHIPTIN